jgi:hypothetical protein
VTSCWSVHFSKSMFSAIIKSSTKMSICQWFKSNISLPLVQVIHDHVLTCISLITDFQVIHFMHSLHCTRWFKSWWFYDCRKHRLWEMHTSARCHFMIFTCCRTLSNECKNMFKGCFCTILQFCRMFSNECKNMFYGCFCTVLQFLNMISNECKNMFLRMFFVMFPWLDHKILIFLLKNSKFWHFVRRIIRCVLYFLWV